jgi:transcriptional regulator with XRE-family HTH domain
MKIAQKSIFEDTKMSFCINGLCLIFQELFDSVILKLCFRSFQLHFLVSMSPFARYLHDLRLRHGIRQSELAEITGCEQSYISSLEIGAKGPPNDEFVGKLIVGLEIPEAEQGKLREAIASSQRKLLLDPDSSEEMFLLFKELREQIHALHPVQIKMIRDALALKYSLVEWQPEPVRRIRRRRNSEATM